LNRWRAAAQATKRRPQTTSTATSPTIYNPDNLQKGHGISREDLIMNGSVWAVNGALPRDREGNWARSDTGHNYETPPNPGAIIGADEGDGATDADADADGDAEDDGNSHHDRSQTALTKHQSQQGFADLNDNGKRPLPPDSAKGRQSGPKMYRAQWYNCNSEQT